MSTSRRGFLASLSALVGGLALSRKDALSFPDAPIIPPQPQAKFYEDDDILDFPENMDWTPRPTYDGVEWTSREYFNQRPRMVLHLSMNPCEHSKMLQEAYFKEHVLRVEHRGTSMPMVVTKVHGVLNPNAHAIFEFELTEVFHFGQPRPHGTFSLDRALRNVILKGETELRG